MKVLIIALLVCLSQSSLYSGKSDVIVLNSNNFKKEVVDSSEIWLVEFYGIHILIT
jgi:hypothetical protein